MSLVLITDNKKCETFNLQFLHMFALYPYLNLCGRYMLFGNFQFH